jgi:c(7)-type cytochrome triheme protein
MRFTLLAGMMLLAASQVFAAVGGGDITLRSKGGDVLFSHETHVSGASQKCTACHDKIYTNSKQHKKVTMKEMQKGKSCGTCHNGKAAFSVKADCAKCHKK